MDDLVPKKRLIRERNARIEAERLLEDKSRELYKSNKDLKALTESLEKQVLERTAELAQAHDDAMRESQEKSRFIAVMSHEVRSPLNGVIGALSLLIETRLDSEQRNFVEAARTSASSLMSIVNDILDYSKIEADKLEIESVEFNPREFLNEILDSFRRSNPSLQGPVLLEGYVADDLPLNIVGDSGRIRQILVNLISNAVKFTEQGEIEVIVQLENVGSSDPKVIFSVRDTGAGISLENQAHLFDEFWSRSARQSSRISGTGLGLPISARLAGLMGGKIELTSEAGEGSHFWFSLPLEVAPEQANETETANLDPEVVGKAGFSGKILLAEDNNVNQLVASAILTKWGLEVDLADNGLEALEKVKAGQYDVVLMDIDMPVMDGLESVEKIRQHFDQIGRHLPVVAVTAYALAGDRERFLSSGFDDYLVKPIEQASLHQCLATWLKAKVAAPDTRESNVGEVPERDNADINDDRAEIDITVLKNLVSDVGQENLSMLADVFVDELEGLKQKISEYSLDKNHEQLKSSAHSLKSSSASFGAMGVSDLARRIEETIAKKDQEGTAALCRELQSALGEVQERVLQVTQALVQKT